MKLHLPKLLLTAVIATMVMVPVTKADVDVAANTTVTASENTNYNVGQGATLDINGTKLTSKKVTLATGATLTNKGNPTGESQEQIKTLNLSGDANVEALDEKAYGLLAHGWNESILGLNAHVLTKEGDGTFYLVNTTVNGGGQIDVAAGTLQIGCNNAEGKATRASDVIFSTVDGATISLVNGGKLIAAGVTGEAGTITGADGTTLQLEGAGTYAYNGNITGNLDLVKSGTGTQSFGGNVTVDSIAIANGGSGIAFTGEDQTITIGAVTIAEVHGLTLKDPSASDGRFYIDGTTPSENGFVKDTNTYLLFDGYTWTGTIDRFEVTQENGNTYVTGQGGMGTEFYVRQGTVTYAEATMARATGYTVSSGATYVRDMGAADVDINSYLSNITAEAGSAVTVKTTGAVTQSTTLTLAENGTLTIDGAASYSNAGNGIANGGTLVFDDVKTVTFSGNTKLSSNVTLLGNTTVTFSEGDCVNYNQNGGLIWTVGTGATLSFGNTRQAFTNGSQLVLAGGSVTCDGDGDGYGAIDAIDNSTLTIKATADSTLAASVRLRNGVTYKFDVDKGVTLTASGLLKGRNNANDTGGKFTKIGEGTLVVSGTNIYGGGTTIQAGTVQTANVSALGTGKVTMDGGRLEQNGAALSIAAMDYNNGTIDNGGQALTVTGAVAVAENKAMNIAGSGANSIGSVTLGNGASLTTEGSLTLAGLTFSLQDYTTDFSKSHTLVSAAGGLTYTGADMSSFGGTVGNYTASVGFSEDNTSIVLTFDIIKSITTTVTGAAFDAEAGMLTLNIDKDIYADGMMVEISGFGEGVLEQIHEMTKGDTDGIVGITLVDSIDTATTYTVVGNGENIGFFGSYYGENVGSNEYRVSYIPEPTTATLSLLALMGLAARRRRK